MSSPIKTRVDELPSSILLPNCMWEYLAQVANEDLQPERSPDPYAPWKAKEKFAEGRMPPDAYLQQVRLQTEAKVCTKNLTSCRQVVDFLLSTLDPVACFGFINRHKQALFDEKSNPYALFLVFFQREWMSEVTETSRYDEFKALFKGPPLAEEARAIHSFLQQTRAAYLSCPPEFVAEKACVVELRRKLPPVFRQRVLAGLPADASWDRWLRECERVCSDLLQDDNISFHPEFVSPPTQPAPFVPPAQPIEGMDIGAIVAALTALNNGATGPICFECGGKGHYARDCPNRKQQQKQQTHKKKGGGGHHGGGGNASSSN